MFLDLSASLLSLQDELIYILHSVCFCPCQSHRKIKLVNTNATQDGNPNTNRADRTCYIIKEGLSFSRRPRDVWCSCARNWICLYRTTTVCMCSRKEGQDPFGISFTHYHCIRYVGHCVDCIIITRGGGQRHVIHYIIHAYFFHFQK